MYKIVLCLFHCMLTRLDYSSALEYSIIIIVLSGIPKQESIFIGSDLNGHVGRDADGYGGVHGGIWYKKR